MSFLDDVTGEPFAPVADLAEIRAGRARLARVDAHLAMVNEYRKLLVDPSCTPPLRLRVAQTLDAITTAAARVKGGT